MTPKRPRHYAPELLEVMRQWLKENVPEKEREPTAQLVKCALFKSLEGTKRG